MNQKRVPVPEYNCYACGHPTKEIRLTAVLIDDNGASVDVGPDCHRRISKAGAQGFVHGRGGPRLFSTLAHREAFLTK